MTDPNFNRAPLMVLPEIRGRLQSSLWAEVMAADKVKDTYPMYSRVPVLEEWDQTDPIQHAFAQAFHRARVILQAITFGDSRYWRIKSNMFGMVDEGATFSSQHEGVMLGTRSLFDLVVLSRVPVEPVKDQAHWSFPTQQGILETIAQVRRELGVEEEYERRIEEDPFAPNFPGVGDTQLVDALLSGQVRIGNPEQPEVVCWHP